MGPQRSSLFRSWPLARRSGRVRSKAGRILVVRRKVLARTGGPEHHDAVTVRQGAVWSARAGTARGSGTGPGTELNGTGRQLTVDEGLGADSDGERVRRFLSRAVGAGVTYTGKELAPAGPDKATRDVLIAELEKCGGETASGPGAELTARLGALVAARWADGRDPDDRTRAIELLREARGMPDLDPGLRRDAARDLAVLLLAPLLDISPADSGADAPGSTRRATVPSSAAAGWRRGCVRRTNSTKRRRRSIAKA